MEYLLGNMGSTLVFLIFLIFAYFLLMIFNLLKNRVELMMKLSEFFNKHMIWNFALIFLNSQFVPIVLPCIINLINIKSDTRIETASAILTVTIFAGMLIVLIKCFHLIFSKTVAFSSRFLSESL